MPAVHIKDILSMAIFYTEVCPHLDHHICDITDDYAACTYMHVQLSRVNIHMFPTFFLSMSFHWMIYSLVTYEEPRFI